MNTIGEEIEQFKLDLNMIKAEIRDMLIDLNYELTLDNEAERQEEIERIVNLLSEV